MADGIEATAEDEPQKATVLICLRPGPSGARRVGLVVRRVLDVSAGTNCGRRLGLRAGSSRW